MAQQANCESSRASQSQQVKKMLRDAICAFCQNTVSHDIQLSVEALIGITVDHGKEFFIVSINELFDKPGASSGARFKDIADSTASRVDAQNAETVTIDDGDYGCEYAENEEYEENEELDEQYDGQDAQYSCTQVDETVTFYKQVKSEHPSDSHTVTAGRRSGKMMHGGWTKSEPPDEFQQDWQQQQQQLEDEDESETTSQYDNQWGQSQWQTQQSGSQWHPKAIGKRASFATHPQTPKSGKKRPASFASPPAKSQYTPKKQAFHPTGRAVGGHAPDGGDEVSFTATYTCSICGVTMTRYDSFRRHKRTIHGSVIHRCTVCSKVCNRADNLVKHMNASHPELAADANAGVMDDY